MGAVAAVENGASPLAIACRGLVKRYGDLTAVDGLDLEVRRGECFGLLGPNGAGKTTTIEILEGILDADGGSVEVLGRSWSDDADELRHRIGVALQETTLPGKLTVEEVVTLFRSFYRTGRTAAEVIASVRLDEKRDTWVKNLSGGQKQRLAVACALTSAPDLLFLDEPTTGLDPQSRRSLWDLVSEFRAGGGTTLLTTHYMEEAAYLCDRVAIMDHGRLIAIGTPAELVATLGAEHLIEFQLVSEGDVTAGDATAADATEGDAALHTGEALAGVDALPGVRRVSHANGSTRLTVGELHTTLPALMELLRARGATLAALSTHTATLEDVFVALTGRQLRDE
jgi:ABC-2 type transport system ATP-binding protein